MKEPLSQAGRRHMFLAFQDYKLRNLKDAIKDLPIGTMDLLVGVVESALEASPVLYSAYLADEENFWALVGFAFLTGYTQALTPHELEGMRAEAIATYGLETETE